MASFIVGLVNGKGGVGKSALSQSLSAEAHRRGYKTLLVDVDEQQSSMDWANAAAEFGHDGPDVIAMGDNLRTQLPAISERYERTFIDCAGRVSKMMAATSMIADLLLIPTAPSILDVWALEKMIDKFIAPAHELRPDLITRVVVNKRRKNTTSAETLPEAIRNVGLEPLETAVGLREEVGWALAEGLGPSTYRNCLAGVEIRRLFDECEDLLLGASSGEARAS